MEYVKFSCGCKFPVVDGKINLSFDPEEHDFNCSATWDLIGEGNTKGVFQLESNFGQQYASKLKPRNIEHLAALTSILRPGCLESIGENGKSVTDTYIDCKNGIEEPQYIHPALQPILEQTYGCNIFQEQSLRMAKDIAGLSLEQSESLRKSIGKKDTELMAKVKGIFLDGCRRTGVVNEEIAAKIFEGIEKSQRYRLQ